MKYLIFLFFPYLLLSESTFITPMEYAARLYKDPRGIGCQLCHGEKGEGKLVASYTHKKVQKTFGGSAINKLQYGIFYKALNSRTDGMPRYFLTDNEIASLYLFLHQDDMSRKTNKGKKVVK